ncbi:TonB-dependent receptor domain-containing protein [Bacteroidota bacterium]
MRLFVTGLLSWFVIINAFSQQDNSRIEGKVVGQDEPLIGANVYWLGTQTGTTTDEDGSFHLDRIAGKNELVISFIGFQNDTLNVTTQNFLEVELTGSVELEGVEVFHRRKSTEVDYLNPIHTNLINDKELLKAACCNLSESFETNPSVDVSFTDAVTGTRQIQMLGLSGPNIQITRENMPDIRGLSAIYGLTYIPGTWVESIQLNKGTGSVANGYESIAGQINVNLRNPASMDRVYLNAYANEGGRFEFNTNLRADIGKNWGTGLLLHGKNNSVKHDRNDDGFLDMPIGNQFIALNRWELYSDRGLHLQLGAKGTYIDNLGGQVDFNPDNDKGTTNSWGMQLLQKRIEGWGKIGKVDQKNPYRSMGLQLSAAYHEQESYFGLNNYDASQGSFYANLMYQGIISNTNHKIKTGVSLQYDDYDEVFNNVDYSRKEIVPGGFLEYTYTFLDKFGAVSGIRVDNHNLFGTFITPRLHLRYALSETTVLRASGGRGQRTANIFSENNGMLASSRQFIIEGDDSNKPYGLNPEIAWNYGLSLVQEFAIDYRDGLFTVDFFRTDFENQIVVDRDRNPQEAVFYNLDGKSYSNSFQVQLDYEVIKRLDARLAYRWYDVNSTFDEQLLQSPLVSNNRAFLNLAYSSIDYWRYDFTLNWQGSKRIPGTSANPEPYILEDNSPDFFVVNAQISKTWREKFEVYVGVENLLNYRQEDPILSSEQPFSPYFDSSLVWGPIFGRNTYLGLRFWVK